MSAIVPQNAISQINQTMLNKLNAKTEQTIKPAQNSVPANVSAKKPSVPAPKIMENDKNGDTITIAGKTIKKKTAAIGAAAIFGTLLAISAAIINGIKKGKINLHHNKTKNTPKSPSKKLSGHKKPKLSGSTQGADTKKPAAKTGKNAVKKVKKPEKHPEIQAPKEEIRPQKTAEELRAEIEAEARRRTQEELKRAETSRIAQDYFFDLNDSSCGKSAKESAVFIQKSAKLNEKGLLGLSEEAKAALSGDFKDYLTESAPSTSGQMKRIARNAAKMEAEFTPDEIKKLSGAKFHIKALLGEYLKGIDDPDGKAEIVEFLHNFAKNL